MTKNRGPRGAESDGMYEIYEYFRDFSPWAVCDILAAIAVFVLAFVFFYRKNSLRVFLLLLGILVLTVVTGIVGICIGGHTFALLNRILSYVFLFVLIMTAVVYQADFKSIFQKIAAPHAVKLFQEGYGSDEELRKSTGELLSALQTMAKQNLGAIIIITPTVVDKNILDTGTPLNALVSSQLLVSVFNTKSPLHDGAVIVKGNKILSAGCFLPLTQESGVDRDLGTRHRAALGITEESNVMAIVVSEETGIISVAENGQLQRFMTIEKLRDRIETVYGISPAGPESRSGSGREGRRFFR